MSSLIAVCVSWRFYCTQTAMCVPCLTQVVTVYTGADVCHQACCWNRFSRTLYSVHLQDVKGIAPDVGRCHSKGCCSMTPARYNA